MSASVARIGAGLRAGNRGAWLITLSGLVGLAASVVVATRQAMLPMLFGIALLGLAAASELRWPLLLLVVFVVLVPVEVVALIDGVGTLSKVAGILFAVVDAIPRVGSLALGVIRRVGWAFVAWSILSLGWAIGADAAWSEPPTPLQLFFSAVLVAGFVVRRPSIVRPVLWAYSLSAAATVLIGTASYVALGLTDTRAAAIQNQDTAQFAAVLLPALVFGLHEALDGKRRIPGGVVALLATVGGLVPGTRAAWVAVVVALLLLLYQLRPRRRLAAIGVILALAAKVSQVPGAIDMVAERAESALPTGGAGRTDIWSAAETIYSTYPVLGVRERR